MSFFFPRSLCLFFFLAGGRLLHSETGDSHKISLSQIGGNYTYATIKVSGQPSFHGSLGGMQGCYVYRPLNGFYSSVLGIWKQGTTENNLASRKLLYLDAEERFGYTYAASDRDWTVTLFSGLGYKHLRHILNQKSQSSITFDYNELYVPVGCLVGYDFRSRWLFKATITWMPQVYPTVYISPLKGARWVLTNTLGNISIELPATYFLTPNRRYSMQLTPFYERWEDGHSTAKTSQGEALGLPKNLYNFWGVALNASFSF